MNRRASGLLLHVSSLPSPYGIGDLGEPAYRFADFLAGSRQRYWQVLPLNPTSTAHDNSPYMSTSAFAANPLFLSPGLMVRDGFLAASDLFDRPQFPAPEVDYAAVELFKERLFDRAYTTFLAAGEDTACTAFCRENAGWLDDYALFTALHKKFSGLPWYDWPEEFCARSPDAMRHVREELARETGRERFLQYLFHVQWQELRRYCTGRGIRIIGDMPIYVDYDSADVWAHPELFRLDTSRKPIAVAGVPPDYFSKTGQLWKNPLYDWERHRSTAFSWWLARLERALSMTDLVRIDHFRGLLAYWEVPADAETAEGGRWVPAPGREFLAAVKARFPAMPVVAEDLGIITPDVRELMREFNLPGMRVLIFAFTGDPAGNPNAPHNIPRDILLYTGTHDNAPVRGWFTQEATDADRRRVAAYLGLSVHAGTLAETLVRLAMISPAETTIFPVQDILNLGYEARMNTPGTPSGNWRWRLDGGMLTDEIRRQLAVMTEVSGRA